MKISGITKKLIACFLITAIMVCGTFADAPRTVFAAGEETATETEEVDEATDEDTGETSENTSSDEETTDEAKEEDTGDTSSDAEAEDAKEATSEGANETATDAGEEKAAEDAKETESPEKSGETKLYISELKLGEGITAEDAQKSLLDEGYFILEKDGTPVNLNYDSASHNVFSDSPKEVYIYLGYKTTTDPDEAITDMAVMNMKGGYSFDDYTKLIENNLETKIKPFMDKFVDAINEYRENYKKPEKSVNHIKADMVRQLLNRYTDDDTDGSPIGDLLLNETKYEMGDKAYNKLSTSEQKKHADIITMLMQGNVTNISLIEKLLVRAADSSDDTWIDRFEETSYDKLWEEMEKAYPNADKSDIEKKLDKKYNDAAKEILDIWDDYAEIAENYEDKLDELTAAGEELKEKTDELGKVEDYKNMDEDQQVDTLVDMAVVEDGLLVQNQDIAAVTVSAQAETRETEDMTIREFFAQPAATFNGENIRNLYPMIASMSKGQLAGLQFLTIADLLDAGFNNVSKLEESVDKIDEIPILSVYEGVNREIFEPGVVAMTNDALRQDAIGVGEDKAAIYDVELAAGIACGVLSVGSALALGGMVSNANRTLPRFMKQISDLQKIINESAIKAKEYEALYKAAREAYLKGMASGVEDENRMALLWWEQYRIEKMPEYYAKRGAEATQKLSSATKSANRLRFWPWVISGVMVVLVGATLFLTFKSFYDRYHIDFTPIPKYMVDEADITTINDKCEKEFIRNDTAYYRVVECNRRSMNKGEYKEHYDKRIGELGDYGDLNGASGKEWLALYTVKYKNAAPILADSLLVRTGEKSSMPPDGYTMGIHMFGELSAYNLQNPKLLYRDPEEIRVYFKQDMEARTSLSAEGGDATDGKDTAGSGDAKPSETGSLSTDRSALLYLVIGFAAGAVVVWVIMFITGRRKKNSGKDATSE